MNEGADFMRVASHLSAPPAAVPPEAAFRSSYGRSYYAALNVACAALTAAGKPISRGPEKHQQVCAYLRSSKDELVSACGTRLEQMRRKRNQCDYEMGASVDATFAIIGYQSAKSIIDDITAARKVNAKLSIS